jgi:hypothetical protein
MKRDSAPRFTLHELVIGVFGSLNESGTDSLPDPKPERLAYAFEKLKPSLEQEAKKRKLDVTRVHLARNPMYGDNPELKDEMVTIGSCRMLSFDAPGFDVLRIKFDLKPYFVAGRPPAINLPGDREMYKELAREFLNHYRDYNPNQAGRN